MTRFITTLLIVLLTMGFFSCNKRKAQLPVNKYEKKDSTMSEMIKLNQLLVEEENKEIEQYIKNSKINFKQDSSGFWINIQKKGNGQKIHKDDALEIAYQVETLSGDTCYTYTKKLTQFFIAGKLEKQRAFNQALCHLSEGDKATIIAPSGLAYGAMGDLNNIPPRATLIYKVYSIKIQQ